METVMPEAVRNIFSLVASFKMMRFWGGWGFFCFFFK